MQDPYEKPVKYYRTTKEAFKDADYACALEVPQGNNPLPWWAVPAWVCILLFVAIAAFVIAHFGG